jgi:tryptophanyl-tRNA synthetase
LVLASLAVFGASTEDVMEVAMRYTTKGHRDLKNDLADAIEEMLKVPKGELRDDTVYLESVAKDGVVQFVSSCDRNSDTCVALFVTVTG